MPRCLAHLLTILSDMLKVSGSSIIESRARQVFQPLKDMAFVLSGIAFFISNRYVSFKDYADELSLANKLIGDIIAQYKRSRCTPMKVNFTIGILAVETHNTFAASLSVLM